jgi:ATP-binding cassette subfamily B protein/subfamily B ATP-binding cassette protein MsbA
MKNFARVVRLSLAHRWSIAGIVFAALGVAVLWGGNIGAIYPLVEVCMKDKTLLQWADEKISSADTKAVQLGNELQQLNSELEATPSNQQTDLRGIIARREQRRQLEIWSGWWYRKLKTPIEAYFPTTPFVTLVALMGLLMLGTAIKSLFSFVNEFLVSRVAQRTAFQLRSQFFRKALARDAAGFSQAGTAQLLTRISADLDGVVNGLTTLLGRAITEPLKMLACLVGAALVSWRLLMFSMIVVPLAGYCIARLSRSLRKAHRRALEMLGEMNHVLIETFSGIKVIKAFATERYERSRFRTANKEYLAKGMRIAMLDALISPVTEIMGIATISVAVLLGAYLAMNRQTHLLGFRVSPRELDLGDLMLFFAMLAGLSDPARKLSDVFNRLQRGAAASDRLFAMLDEEPTIRDPEKPSAFPSPFRTITFDDIEFGYSPGTRVLQHVSLQIVAGETIAIVGPNGCGKSTLLSLLPRFYDPANGSVRIDQTNVRELRLADLRRQIGIVTQEPILFDDTVYNNIRYGSPWASRAQIIAAAEKAHARQFIEEQLENGYETRCGQLGNKLSGGQRQRIALARAMLRDPAILILDEATSQIDVESEQLIHQALAEFVKNRTSLMITHRMSTLELADRIVVMDQGRIQDVGPHDQLLRRCGLYRRIRQTDQRAAA